MPIFPQKSKRLGEFSPLSVERKLQLLEEKEPRSTGQLRTKTFPAISPKRKLELMDQIAAERAEVSDIPTWGETLIKAPASGLAAVNIGLARLAKDTIKLADLPASTVRKAFGIKGERPDVEFLESYMASQQKRQQVLDVSEKLSKLPHWHPKRIIGTGLQAVPQVAAVVGAALIGAPFIGGTISAATMLGAIAYGPSAEEAKAEGATEIQQVLHGITSAQIEVLTELPVFMAIGKLWKYLSKAGIAKKAGVSFAKRLLIGLGLYGKGLALETTQEVEAYLGGQLSKRLHYDPNATINFKDAVEAGYGGFAMAATVGIAGVPGMAIKLAKTPPPKAPEAPMTTISEETTVIAKPEAGIEPTAPMRALGMRRAEPAPIEPVTEIPIFKTTNEAIAFGEKATPEQIAEMKELRQDAIDKFNILMKQDKFDEASIEATRGQFYQEAYQAAEKPAKKVAVEKAIIKTQQPGDVFSGEAFRVEPGTMGMKGLSALDKVKFEAEELGNLDILKDASIVAKKHGIDLSKTTGEDIVWVTRDKKTANELYGYGKDVAEKISLPKDAIVLADIGSDGVLVYKGKPPAPAKEIKPKAIPEVKPKVEKEVIPFTERTPSEKKIIEEYNKKMTPEEWKKEYAKRKPHYIEEKKPSPLADEMLKDLKRDDITKGDILEIGIGNGRDSIYLAKKGHNIKGIDVVEKAVETAKTAAKGVKGIAFEVGDAEALQYADASFDAVYSIAALHATPIKFTFPEIYRVLKPGGQAKLFLYTRTKTGDKWVSYWTPGEIKQYAKEAGFKIEKFREGHDIEPIDIPDVEGKIEQETHLVITTLRKPAKPSEAAEKEIEAKVIPEPKLKVEKEKIEVEITPEGKEITVDLTKKEEVALTPKQQKEYLMAEIDKAIETELKTEGFEGGIVVAKDLLKRRINPLIQSLTLYTFEVPNDGTFEIRGNNLFEFQDRVKSAFPATIISKKFKPKVEARKAVPVAKYNKIIGIAPEKLTPELIDGIFKEVAETEVRDITGAIQLNPFQNWLLSQDISKAVVDKIKSVAGKDYVDEAFQKEAPRYAVKQSISDTDITLSDVRKLFKPKHAGILKDGNIWVKLKSGYGFHVKNVQSITEDKLAFEVGHGRMKADGEFVAGKFEKDTIEIVRGIGDVYTLSHESEHLTEKTGLITPLEIVALKSAIKRLVRQGKFETANKDDIGGQEDRAKFIETELHRRATYKYKGTIQRILNKIADFVDSFVNLFTVTSRGIVREFETGKIFARKAEIKPKAIPAFAVKKLTVAEELPPQKPPRIPSPYEKFKDDWFGEKDWAVVRDEIEKSKLQNIIKATVGQKKNIFGQKIFDKEAQKTDQAIHLYLDLKRNPEHREKYYDELPPEWKRVVDKIDSIETNPKLKAIADYIRNENDKTGRKALEADVIHNWIENHVNRAWRKREGISERTYTDALQKFKTKSRHAKHRIFDTILEGLALKDKAGKYIFDLQIKGATSNLQTLKDEIARVIEDKKLITDMRKTKSEDGNPLLSTHRVNDTYVEIEHPNFTVWEVAAKVALIEKETDESTGLSVGDSIRAKDRGNIGKIIAITDESVDVHFINKKEGTEKTVSFKKDAVGKLERPLIKVSPKGINFFITDEGIVYEKRSLYAPEEIARDLNKILGVSRLIGVRILGVPVIDILTKYNAIFKSWILVTSFFHHQAFLRSYYLPTQHKTWAEWNPVKAYKMGRKAIEDMTPEVELLVRNGMTMFKMQDWEESILRSEDTAFGKILDKSTKTKAIKDKINELRERQANFLFGNFGAALKVQAALIELRNMTRRYPSMDVQERAKMVARLINDDFGGLHLGRLGRDPTIQHIMRLLLLAPDWTESNVRTMVKAFKAGGPEETAMYRRFWTSALTKGFSAIFVANILMAALDDDSFAERYKKAWKAGHFRWLDIDITPIYKMFGGKSEARKYFSLFGHFRDPLKFIRHPIRSLHHKGSVIYGTFHEAMSGTDWRGHRFTTLFELIGIDDKGVYLKTTKTHKKGEPKGGRLAGKLTIYGRKGPLSLEQMPSYIISQLLGIQPIQIQNLIAMLTGEVAAFDAIARSLGLHTGTTYPTVKSIRSDFVKEYILLKKENKDIKTLRNKVAEYNSTRTKDKKAEFIKWGSIVKSGNQALGYESKTLIPGTVPWKATKKKKRSVWQKSVGFGKKPDWQKPAVF